jgi:hypothetical protein
MVHLRTGTRHVASLFTNIEVAVIGGKTPRQQNSDLNHDDSLEIDHHVNNQVCIDAKGDGQTAVGNGIDNGLGLSAAIAHVFDININRFASAKFIEQLYRSTMLSVKTVSCMKSSPVFVISNIYRANAPL